MKLYLNEKLESIPIFNQLKILLDGLLSHPTMVDQIKSIEDIYSVNHIEDPVKEFVLYWINNSSMIIDDVRLSYIINSIYASKGAPEVLNTISEVMGINIKYTFDFPILTITEITKLELIDLESFITKFNNTLYYLLYYTELNIYIKELILLIKNNLTTYYSSHLFGFNHHTITKDNIQVI